MDDTIPTHYTAWLTNNPAALDQPNMDIAVLEDDLVGDPDDGDTAWVCMGNDPVFYAVTDMSVDDYTGDPCARAANILCAAGWSRVGEWTSVDTGYIATVTRG